MAEAISKARTFVEESWSELQKVTWPDQDQLRNATWVIILFVIGISAVIWLMDVTVRTILNSILGLFGA